MKCLIPSDADYALREVHEGICAIIRGRSLAYKIIRQGYYWPTMQKDAADFVRRCDSCQRYANIQRRPASQLA
ncbi:integrase zinc binding domain-containing protein [Areca yellow leaf disease phytoplasma]|uniref:integrase zinc binding domain-containing protein n=1 Tax=Areca yellow leaf disease phytoplasma TaxID=927614 RepID=UPI0035B4FF0A